MEEYLEKIAKEKLNEIPKRKENDLVALKNWITKQPHLIARIDDEFLITFLRKAKYQLESAKQNIDSFHTFRTKCPDFFKNRLPLTPNQSKLLERGIILPLLQPHPNDYGRIVISEVKQINQNNCNLSDMIKCILMVTDKYLITDEHATIIGQHGIIDLEGTTMDLATQSIAVANIIVSVVENIYPLRIICLHIINLNKAPPIFKLVIKTYKGLCKTKLSERIKIHDNLESLYKEIPKSMLPEKYGGDAGSIESLMKSFLNDQNILDEKWYQEDEKYKTEESNRIGVSKLNDLFGTEGSFRQLNID